MIRVYQAKLVELAEFKERVGIVLLRELLQAGYGGVQLLESCLNVLRHALPEQLLDGVAILGEGILFQGPHQGEVARLRKVMFSPAAPVQGFGPFVDGLGVALFGFFANGLQIRFRNKAQRKKQNKGEIPVIVHGRAG